jgi:alginate O-acetyltransferase complex protein AlgI
MVFSSTVFLFLFLPLTLIVHFFLHPRFRNFFLLLMSLVFYAWGEGGHTLLIGGSIIINYLGGILIGHFKSRNQRTSKILLASFIVINLLVLIYFKYFNFIVTSMQDLGMLSDLVVPRIHLPIGISFYTFHIMSYLVDVYRRDAVAQKNPFDLGLYIFLFPQLVAGPIIRYKDISAKIAARFVVGEEFAKGVIRFIRGLAKKMILANTVAVIADQVFATPASEIPVAVAWLGILCYTLQIYFDFSGYSDMAIGIGKMLGFNFPENFDHPYVAASLREFWQRWHISLSTWFRDYLYIPLGGNKKGKLKTVRNLFIVFFITGLWHGASLNFIVWGLFHGFFLALERTRFGTLLSRLPGVLRHGYTILVVMAAWVFFRANNLHDAVAYLEAMAGRNSSQNYMILMHLNNYVVTMIVLAIIFCTGLRPKINKIIADKLSFNSGAFTAYSVIRYLSYMILFFFSCVELAQHNYNPFIYFRF